jgi:hypothetical protein
MKISQIQIIYYFCREIVFEKTIKTFSIVFSLAFLLSFSISIFGIFKIFEILSVLVESLIDAFTTLSAFPALRALCAKMYFVRYFRFRRQT